MVLTNSAPTSASPLIIARAITVAVWRNGRELADDIVLTHIRIFSMSSGLEYRDSVTAMLRMRELKKETRVRLKTAAVLFFAISG